MANTFDISESDFLAEVTALNNEESFLAFFRSGFHEGLLALRRLELKGRVLLLDRPQKEHPHPYPIFVKFSLPEPQFAHYERRMDSNENVILSMLSVADGTEVARVSFVTNVFSLIEEGLMLPLQ